MRSRLVPPHTTTLEISHGDTLLVRTRLNHGETQAAYARVHTITGAGRIEARLDVLLDAMVCAYLLDWSLTDEDGRPLPIRGASADDIQAALNGLGPEDVVEIRTAIEAHTERVAAARAAEKKTRPGSPGDGVTSPWRSAADGASNGSASSTPTTTLSSLTS